MATGPQPAVPGSPLAVTLYTPDIDGCRQFYGTVFGWDVPSGPGPIVDRDGVPIVGVRWMTYLFHPDVDAAVEVVTASGGSVVVPPRDTPTGRVTAVLDPGSAVVTLLTPAARPA